MKDLIAREEAFIRDMEANVTHIYRRPLFHMMHDLVYHSVLAFNFKGTPVRRGWVEGGIVGDTRTGKSEVMQRLNAHYGVAAPADCERTSMAGLVGGLSKLNSNGHNTISWGFLPLQDRRAAVLDEVTGLSCEDISSLSGLRSSGVAEIIKIEKERTFARVRKIWLCNPRAERNRKISTYTFGVLCVPEVVGRAEDVARFDIFTAGSSNDVPLEVLNQVERPTCDHTYTTQRCRELLYWCWRREPEQVVWQEGAEDLVLKLATEQCRKYHSSIPLVEPGDQRFKLARMAVAWAARFFSTDETRQLVLIEPKHVEFAAWVMDQCYQHPAFAYDKYSKAKGDLDKPLLPEEVTQLKKEMNDFPFPDAVRIAIQQSGLNAAKGVLPYESFSKVCAFFVAQGLASLTDKGPVLTGRGAEFLAK